MIECAWEGCTDARTGKSKYCPPHKHAARARWLDMVKSKPSAAERDAKHRALHNKAHAAGLAASEAHKPTPFGPLTDGHSVFMIEGGPCGFAWVVIRPGTCSFAKWAKANLPLTDKHYYGGVSMWCPLGTQSMTTKEAYCRAYAAVLSEAGIKAVMGSRMD